MVEVKQGLVRPVEKVQDVVDIVRHTIDHLTDNAINLKRELIVAELDSILDFLVFKR